MNSCSHLSSTFNDVCRAIERDGGDGRDAEQLQNFRESLSGKRDKWGANCRVLLWQKQHDQIPEYY